MPDALVTYGPITRKQANHRRIKYGPLTISQFDDLDRINILGKATALDMRSASRECTDKSIMRYMGRHIHQGWVENVDAQDVWRLTAHGERVLGFAYDHMDTMLNDYTFEGE